MRLVKQKPLWLLLWMVFLGACQQSTDVQRRSVSQDNRTGDALPAQADNTDSDTTLDRPDPSFSPDDPNTFANKPGVAFPSVNFTVESVPTGTSDRYNFSLPVKADASISHYAFKIDTSPSCDKTGGYTVGEAKNPIPVSIDKAPMGAIYLCVIAFHFPTRQWQDMTKAQSFNWQKIPFARTIDTYYEFVDPVCNMPARVNAKISVDGDKGSYVWTRINAEPKCKAAVGTFTDLMSLIQVTDTSMQGAWHEGDVVAGWFKFTWSNAERTAFKGTWGYGEPGVKTEGVWNSVAN